MTVVASNYERKAQDLYETERWATEALLRYLPLYGKVVWEPAAGNHLMVDVLRERAFLVWSSDVTTYDRRHEFIFDFLNLSDEPPKQAWLADAIITNPPYGKRNRDAVRWAERALARCDHSIALLLTAKFDFGKTRQHLFRDCPRFMAKIALVDRIQWFPGDTTGTEDHAWYIWGPTSGAPYTPRMYWEGRQAAEARLVA